METLECMHFYLWRRGYKAMYNLDIYCLVVQDGVFGDLGVHVLSLVAKRVQSHV